MNIPGRKKSYASIISPLGGMINNLVTHIKEQGANIITLNKRKAEIDSQIDHYITEVQVYCAQLIQYKMAYKALSGLMRSRSHR